MIWPMKLCDSRRSCGAIIHPRHSIVTLLIAAGAVWGQTAACGDNSPQPTQAVFHQAWSVPAGTNLTVRIPSEQPGLVQALKAIADWNISASSQVTLWLEPGIHAQTECVRVHHRCGARLRIVGSDDAAKPSVLRWTKATDGLYVGQNHVLGHLARVRIEHAAQAARGNGSGVLADEGAHIHCGPGVSVSNFYYGFTARRRGSIRCAGSKVEGAGDAGYFAYMGGHLDATGTESRRADDRGRQLGSGYVAEYNGTIDAANAVATECFLAGFNALSGGAIRAHRAIARKNSGNGFQSRDGGLIIAHDASSVDNGGYGVVNPGGGIFAGERFVNRGNKADQETRAKD
jgi:hypothetical protein